MLVRMSDFFFTTCDSKKILSKEKKGTTCYHLGKIFGVEQGGEHGLQPVIQLQPVVTPDTRYEEEVVEMGLSSTLGPVGSHFLVCKKKR